MSPFSHSEWIKFAIFALIVRPKKKVADEQTYNRGTKVCNFYDVANTDEQKAIAEAIGVDKSTVYREIKRNCDARSGSYSMELAQKSRQAQAAKHRKGSAYTGNEKTDNKAVEERIQPGADCRQEPLGGNCDGISRNDISLDLGG